MGSSEKSNRAVTAIVLYKLAQMSLTRMIHFSKLYHIPTDQYRIKREIETFYEAWYAAWALAIGEGECKFMP